MAETKIYLIRHGAYDNPSRVYPGTQQGFPLNENGQAQVRQLAEILKSKGIVLDAIYTSPLERALQSAQIISEIFGKVKITEAEDLKDTHIPNLEGRPLSILEAEGYGNEYDIQFQGEGSETRQDVIDRTWRLLNRVKQDHPGESIALFSHGDPIRFMLEESQNRGKASDLEKLRDEDYPELAEAIELRFGSSGEFLGVEHIRREKEPLREDDMGSRLKEV